MQNGLHVFLTMCRYMSLYIERNDVERFYASFTLLLVNKNMNNKTNKNENTTTSTKRKYLRIIR